MARMAVALAFASGTAVGLYALWRRRRRRRLRVKVAVLCAVREEARHIEERLERVQTMPFSVGTRRYRRVRGVVGRVVVDVVTCGIGSVDATATATALLSAASFSLVVNCGCSGGHREEVRAGDCVVGASVVPSAYKMVRADGSSEHVGLRLDTSSDPLRELAVDAGLLRVAEATAGDVDLPPWPTTPHRRPVVHTGKIASSDIWTQHRDDIRRQSATLGTLCEEMESFAVARVCDHFGLPWLTVKDVVNNELLDDDDDDHSPTPETGLGESLVLDELGRRAAIVVIAILRALDANNVEARDELLYPNS